MLNFFVPPGIGDFSSMYAKLCNLGREFSIGVSHDAPQRLVPFLKLLPAVTSCKYSQHGSMASVMNTVAPGTNLHELPDGDYFLSINTWLEEGNRVEDWVPGPTTFHYQINIPEEDSKMAHQWLGGHLARVGLYTSAYGNSRHWGFWGWEQWRDFLDNLLPLFHKANTEFVFIGADYDIAISEILNNWLYTKGYACNFLIGALEIGGTIEVIRNLDYLFAFPSGIGFLADVVSTPNLMWFPQSLNRMRYTFIDPKNFDEGITLHHLFTTPQEAALEWRSSLGPNQFYAAYERRIHAKNLAE